MKNTRYKKFALIGLPGSGNSTFASKLGETLDIPVHHLDRHMFEPGGKKRDKNDSSRAFSFIGELSNRKKS